MNIHYWKSPTKSKTNMFYTPQNKYIRMPCSNVEIK